MEYLMTYGWSILIVAIVLVVLFAFGVFGNSGSSGASSCIPLSGYQCNSAILYSSGYLSATIGQVGQAITIISAGCSSGNAAPAMPSSYMSQPISYGQSATIGFQCPSTGLSTLGSKFTGTLWIEYNIQNGAQGVTQKIATFKGTVTAASSSLSGAIAHVPVNVINSQSSSTGSSFQQMVSFNPSTYSGYLSADLGNVRFYQGSTELYSWCESGCSYSSSSAVFWVNLPSGVGANSNLLINMSLLPTNTEYDGVYAGEAPQLTCTNTNTAICGSGATYGKYDNGASVFSYYTNFGGASLPSNWQDGESISGNGYASTVTVSNGISVGSTGSDSSIQYDGVINAATMATDAYGGAAAGASTSLCQGCWGMLTDSGGVPIYGTQAIIWSSGSTYYYTPDGGTTWTNTGTGIGYAVLTWSQNAANRLYLLNYVQYSAPSSSLTSSFFFAVGGGSGYAADYFQWFRTRAAPPNGVMPTTSFASLSH
jgi:hypothetical protein